MSEVVHLLWFVKEMPEGQEDVELLIGVYSSEVEARAGIERVRNKRGFAEFHEGFQIEASHFLGKYAGSYPSGLQASVADIEDNRLGGGDLAKYLVLTGYSIRF